MRRVHGVLRYGANLGQAILNLAMGAVGAAAVPAFSHREGPGKTTVYTEHRDIARRRRSRYPNPVSPRQAGFKQRSRNALQAARGYVDVDSRRNAYQGLVAIAKSQTPMIDYRWRRMWRILTDREYVDTLFSYAAPDHGHAAFLVPHKGSKPFRHAPLVREPTFSDPYEFPPVVEGAVVMTAAQVSPEMLSGFDDVRMRIIEATSTVIGAPDPVDAPA